MGHALGRELLKHGFDVITALKDRSQRTKALAQSAGLRDVQTLPQLALQAQFVLSILVPSEAERAAQRFAEAIGPETTTHYVDCNAVSPETVKRIGKLVTRAGATFSDGSIIGLPPGTGSETPRLYVSGPKADEVQALDQKGIAVKALGEAIGQASGIKMCYAAMTKGTFALQFALAVVAQRLDLLDPLLAEFEFSQTNSFQRMHKVLPKLPAKAWRWVGEMEQIADTFRSVDMTPQFHEAAACIYDLISNTTLGRETPETIDLGRSLETTIAEIAKQSNPLP